MTKPVYPDDLRKGMYVVVTGKRQPPNPFQFEGNDTLQMIPRLIEVQHHEPSGSPFYIHAVSLPFIVGRIITNPLQLTTIYLKDYELRIPSRAYVNTFLRHIQLVKNLPQDVIDKLLS